MAKVGSVGRASAERKMRKEAWVGLYSDQRSRCLKDEVFFFVRFRIFFGFDSDDRMFIFFRIKYIFNSIIWVILILISLKFMLWF